jgi:hypothetical protein
MKRNSVILEIEPDRKFRRFRIVPLLPVVLVPVRPGMVVLLIAFVEIGAFGASPPNACGMVVGRVAPPASSASEPCLRISAPVLNACFPFVQLSESPYVHKLVVSRYVAVLPPPR